MANGDDPTAVALTRLAAVMARIEVRLGAQPGEEGEGGGVALTEEQRRADAAHYRDSQQALTAILEQYQEIDKMHALDLDYQAKSKEFFQNKARVKRNEIAELLEIGNITADQLDVLEREVKELEQQASLWETANNFAKDYQASIGQAASAAKGLGKSLGSAFAVFSDINAMGAIQDVTKSLQGGTASVGAFGAALATGITSAVIDNMVGLAVAAYDTENAFRRMTGATAEQAAVITDAYEATRLYGVELEEMSATMTALRSTFTDFTMITGEQQEEVAKTGAVLAELGVSTGDFAQGIQNATKIFGQSATQAADTQLELRALATQIGVAPEKMAADFAKAGSSMAKFGDQGVKAFKDLAVVAKITGMEVDTILNMVKEFDTFEGAAEQAGKLNAALGGNFVNAMDLMMETNPVERFNMMRNSILDAGLSFDSMSYYQKQFYTESLGLADVGELALMLSGNMDSLNANIEKSEAEYVAAAEAAKNLQSIQDLLKSTMASLIPVVTPIVTMFANFIKSLTASEERIMALKVALGIITLATLSLGIAMAIAAVSLVAVQLAGGPITLAMYAIAAAVALVVGGIALLIGGMEEGEEKTTGFGVVFEGIAYFMNLVYDEFAKAIEPIVSFFKHLYEGAQQSEGFLKILKGIGYVLGAVLLGPLLLVAQVLKLVGAAFSWVSHILFKEEVASTFLEGLGKIGDAFGFIGQAAKFLMSPITLVKGAFSALSEMLFGEDVGASTFFEGLHKIWDSFSLIESAVTLLTAPFKALEGVIATMGNVMGVMASSMTQIAQLEFGHLADDFVAIALAISEVPIMKAVALTATLAAVTTANTAATALATVTGGRFIGAALGSSPAAGGAAAAPPAGGTGGERPYNVTIKLEMDGDVLAKKQVQFLGGTVKSAFVEA